MINKPLAAILSAVVLVSVSGCSTSNGSSNDRASETTTSIAESAGPTTTGPLGSGPPPISSTMRIEVLSSQPDRITGDDARIRVHPKPGTRVEDLNLTLNDVDVTSQLVSDGDALEGVVTGFIEGNNTLVASNGTDKILQRARAWPLTGPVFSGPQFPLSSCTTEQLGLGKPTDENCSAPRKVTKAGGEVTVERGTINRSVYEIASPQSRNGRFVIRLAGDCGATFGQGTEMVAPDAELLGQGYVLISATFAGASANCNDVLAAETLSMVKERAIELFGVPKFTIGIGENGGGALGHLIVQNYPGILNGLTAIDPLADHLSVLPAVADCAALEKYYSSPSGRSLSAAGRRAINDQNVDGACKKWVEQLYGATVSAPECATPGRCTIFDALRNQLGPESGDTYRTLDNEGLQYGFKALNDGAITFDQFIDLNRAVGGWDDKGRLVASRTSAPIDGVAKAYETGRISMGGGDQLNVPVIDIARYDSKSTSIYDLRRLFSLRDRLTRGGDAALAPGFAIWAIKADGDKAKTVVADSVLVLDKWLDALSKDREGGSMSATLTRTKPDAAADIGIEDVEENLGGDPRTGAGGPRAGHVLKCELKAPELNDYALELTNEQLQQLRETFPTGVCNWYSPSSGQTIPAAPDRTYEDFTTPQQDA